ncbi:MAG: protein kinase family protein [Campylobacter sp.]|nr:protein kinase family protein [Campylobacter sp.]
MDNNLENYIAIILEKFIDFYDKYSFLYLSFNNDEIIKIFSTLHTMIINSFEAMNTRLPATETSNRHFWAENSRTLKKAIEISIDMETNFRNTEFDFCIDEEYCKLFDYCLNFLEESGGSALPIGMEKIKLYYRIPIFNLNNTHTKNSKSVSFELKFIGSGSYAQVFKYKDLDYDKFFCIKRANKNINDSEKERFIREFDCMKKLKSPYILEVYKFDKNNYEYIMEYMDTTLLDYINKNNSRIDKTIRKSIGLQIIKAMEYLWSKEMLHRDLSPKNILLNLYDDNTVVCKIADFGLVKLDESNLTNPATDIKGSFNDISELQRVGFNNYGKVYEIYALTKILYFVATGKINLQNERSNFVSIGLNSDINSRFKDLQDLKSEFIKLLE